MSNPFFSWRSAILASDLAPTTRHVLLTLSCHMNDAGESCYPSINLLCKETGLSNRAIITHLHNATDLGWVKVKKQGLTGQQWARNSYQLSWDHLNNKVMNLLPLGGEHDDVKAVNEVHTSTSLSTSISTSIEHSESNAPATPVGFAAFWDAFPRMRRGSKSKCEQLWSKKKLESKANEILAHIAFKLIDWEANNFKFAPGALPYLNKEEWDGWEDTQVKPRYEDE